MAASHAQPGTPGFGAVLLTGGTAVRLDGADKAGIEVGGRTLLEIALAALGDAGEVVVVGEEVPTSRPVTFRREEPAHGGPAAGVLAGLAGFARPWDWVVVLAVDMPRVTRTTVGRLLTGRGPEGSVLVDAEGRRQPLCAVYAARSLAAAGEAHGIPMQRLVGGLDLAEVPAAGDEARDVDSWADVRRLREEPS
ncbi:MAG: molybdenum cofactor guanylyltransferase [Marmoricola sp.]